MIRKILPAVVFMLAAVNAWHAGHEGYLYVTAGLVPSLTVGSWLVASAVALVATYRAFATARAVFVPDYVPVRVTEDELL